MWLIPSTLQSFHLPYKKQANAALQRPSDNCIVRQVVDEIHADSGPLQAVRALAFKWIRVIYRCWQTRTEYSEVKYLESLRKKGSPLLGYAAEHAA